MSFYRGERPLCGLSFEGETSVVQPQFAKFCGVSNMISRALNGDNSVYRRGGIYADVTVVPETLQEALNIQIKARDAYNALPPNVRARYTTPEAFFAACHSPNEIETLMSFGLVNESSAPAPVKVEVVTSATAPEPTNGSAATNT